ncbi:MAG: hypothetical protein JSU01_20575 [Bacteroidetes bacterium]|nr:hypothetical protein [Bacteroidota bacterium]
MGDKTYVFHDIWKNKYCDYQKLPYLYETTQTEIQIVRKRFLNYDDWEKIVEVPIDQIGDKKITSGYVTIDVMTRRRSGKLVVTHAIQVDNH